MHYKQAYNQSLESCTFEWRETSALLLLKQGYLCIKLEADSRQFVEGCVRKVSHVFCLLAAHKYIVENFTSNEGKFRQRRLQFAWVSPQSLGIQPCMRKNLAPACVILMLHLDVLTLD